MVKYNPQIRQESQFEHGRYLHNPNTIVFTVLFTIIPKYFKLAIANAHGWTLIFSQAINYISPRQRTSLTNMQVCDIYMRTEISQFFIERVWEKHAMLISVLMLSYGVDFMLTHKIEW